jgi:hypothetical protein
MLQMRLYTNLKSGTEVSMVSIQGLAGAVVAGGFGALIAWNGWTAHAEQKALLNDAVEVDAVVTNISTSQTKERVDIENGGSTMRTQYVPHIAFEYTFDGETYTANNVEPPAGGVDTASKYRSESRARSHFDRYEEGQRTTAYVTPESPAEGFLERETNALRNIGSMLFGGLLILIGVVSAVASVLIL